VGILLPLTTVDRGIDWLAESLFGVSTGLVLTGSIVAVIYAYLVRFMAIPLNGLEASLQKVSLTMDAAARSLGSDIPGVMARVHVPLLRGSVLTAALVVFVDVVKELPATLILRPFNFDTLATQAYRLASDERLAESSTACLVIAAVGLVPVIILTRRITGPQRTP
ncbi:MAG: iron ABC transporter permease, partial [Pseudomonadota bacterium]